DYALSKVPLQPIIPQRFFPELSVLSDNRETIRDEALALYQMGHIKAKDDLPASSFYKDGRWVSFYLKVYDSDIPSARELAPKTLALLEQVPNMNLALFAVLMPGKTLSNHPDPFAFTLRYSLGLSTPNSDGSASKSTKKITNGKMAKASCLMKPICTTLTTTPTPRVL